MRPSLQVLTTLSILLAAGACSSSSSGGDSHAQAGRGGATAGADWGEAGSHADELGGAPGAGGEAGSAGQAGAPGEPACSPWKGDAQFGSARDDTVLALASGSGGVVAGGYFEGTLGATNIEPSGDSRGFVRALSTSGATVWESLHDIPGSDTVEALAVNAAGAVLGVGRTNAAFPGFISQGKHDGFVALFSAGGEPLDLQQFGDERPQHPRRVAFVGEAGALIGGYDDAFVPTNYVEDWENPFFARFEGLGSSTPTHTFVADRTANSDFSEGLAGDAETGDVFVSGVTTTGTNKGLFVRRRAPDGTLRWSTRLTTLGLDIPGPLLATADGTLWQAAAWVRSTPTSDIVLLHIDAVSGEVLDSFDFPTEDAAEEASALVRDAQGDFWLAGTSIGPAFPGATALGDEDAIVLHIAPDGTLIDAWQGGTPTLDMGRALAIDGCGNVILGGTTNGELVPGAAQGESDAFVLRVPLELRR